MHSLEKAVLSLQRELNISAKKKQSISAHFQREMIKGLTGRNSSLKMLPSYLTNPSGQETGTFLSLDLGGSNVRLYLLDLLGHGSFNIRETLAFPLKSACKNGVSYDYTAASVTGEELFDFIVSKLKNLISKEIPYSLGLTFSYPCKQIAIDQAVLLKWTKEIKTAEAVGKNIGEMLTAALRKQQVNNVTLKAIINDTVAAQVAGAYSQQHCRIASIIGTGHNSCYLENRRKYLAKAGIINIEAGNFNKLPFSLYDKKLDKLSVEPGTQLLEKMVSGKYLGELVRLILLRFSEEGLLFRKKISRLSITGVFSTPDMSTVLGDNTKELGNVSKLLFEKLGITNSTYEERLGVYMICQIVQKRSACLAATSYLSILEQIDGLSTPHVIAVDGSLYNKMPEYAEYLDEALVEGTRGKKGTVTVKPVKDGSALGAALAAAMQ